MSAYCSRRRLAGCVPQRWDLLDVPRLIERPCLIIKPLRTRQPGVDEGRVGDRGDQRIEAGVTRAPGWGDGQSDGGGAIGAA